MLFHAGADMLPRILVSETEERRLTALATAVVLTQRSQDVAHKLLAEMERADVVSDGDMPSDVVRMNSCVEFEMDGTNRRRVEIVFPHDADIDAGRVSILTPIGTALVGLSVGQIMIMQGNDGRVHKLKVISVVHPATAT